MTRTDPPDAAWCFEVAEGPNAGARIVLPPGTYRLGRDGGNDIVLADPSVAGEQASLQLAAAGGAIMALDAGAQLGRCPLAIGRNRALRAGSEIRIGSTRLRVSAPATPVPRLRRTLGLAAGALALLGAGTSYRALSAVPSTSLDPPGEARAAPLHAGVLPEARAAFPATPGAEEAGAAFRTHLDEAGLGEAIRVATADGAVLATGALPPGDAARWTEAQKWFDGQFSHLVLRGHIETSGAAQTPQLEIAAVSLEPIPFVVARDGQRYIEGAVLQDGWSVQRITGSEVVLGNGDRVVRMRL